MDGNTYLSIQNMPSIEIEGILSLGEVPIEEGVWEGCIMREMEFIDNTLCV